MHAFISELKKRKEYIEEDILFYTRCLMDSFPFQTGDKIRFRYKGYLGNYIERVAWVEHILPSTRSADIVSLLVNYPRKDGERSKRRTFVDDLEVDNIEVLTE